MIGSYGRTLAIGGHRKAIPLIKRGGKPLNRHGYQLRLAGSAQAHFQLNGLQIHKFPGGLYKNLVRADAQNAPGVARLVSRIVEAHADVGQR